MKTFSGIDVCNETSLFEYSFLSRPHLEDYKDEYFVIYQVGEKFDWGYIRETDLDNLVQGKDWMNREDIESFLSCVGSDGESWLKLPFNSKLSDMLSYWGYENIFGTSYYPLDLEKFAFYPDLGL